MVWCDVNVMQNGSDTLGIGIAGGRFTCGYDTPIYVTNVQPDGCLAKTGQISVAYKCLFYAGQDPRGITGSAVGPSAALL